MRRIAVGVLIVLPMIANASKKEHDWLIGTTLDTMHNRYFAGTIHNATANGSVSSNGSSNTYGGTTNGSSTGSYSGTSSGSDQAIYRVFENYVIDSGSFVYLAEERLRWRWSHPAHLIINGPVKYFVDGRKLYILDEDGKEHETQIVKQVLKTPQK